MIACLDKNGRGATLFDQLSAINPRFQSVGVVSGDRLALRLGFLKSATTDIRQMKRDARMSPDFLNSMSTECEQILSRQKEPIEAVLYWGATNDPRGRQKQLPYMLITDGPFDPNDASYPVEWKPKRWRNTYFEMQRELFRGAAHTFTLSEWARRKILEVHNVPCDRVTKIGWGPLANFGPFVEELPTGAYNFLSVGSDWRRKGMDIVAAAAKRVHAVRSDVVTTICGVPGDLHLEPAPGLRLMAHSVPPATVHDLMRQSRALLIPARFDASPHVIYEALQYGTPVIGSNVCGIPEAIDAPKGGIVLQEQSAEALADAMLQMLDQPEKQTRRSAYEVFLASGGWKGSAEIIDAVVARELASQK